MGINRTSDRTIQFFSQYQLTNQQSFPVGIGIWGSIDGTNNFSDSYSPALGAVVSRELGRYGAVYAHPIWVNNTNPEPSELVDDNDSFLVGVRHTAADPPDRLRHRGGGAAGRRLRAGRRTVSFGVEKRVGGHAFALNFSNGFGTTMAQIARGGTANDDWYIGFNISRKFY